jgi:hypothetical protein
MNSIGAKCDQMNLSTGFDVLTGVVMGVSNLWDINLLLHKKLTYYWTTYVV